MHATPGHAGNGHSIGPANPRNDLVPASSDVGHELLIRLERLSRVLAHIPSDVLAVCPGHTQGHFIDPYGHCSLYRTVTIQTVPEHGTDPDGRAPFLGFAVGRAAQNPRAVTGLLTAIEVEFRPTYGQLVSTWTDGQPFLVLILASVQSDSGTLVPFAASLPGTAPLHHNAVEQGVRTPAQTLWIAQVSIVKVALRPGHNARISENPGLRRHAVPRPCRSCIIADVHVIQNGTRHDVVRIRRIHCDGGLARRISGRLLPLHVDAHIGGHGLLGHEGRGQGQ